MSDRSIRDFVRFLRKPLHDIWQWIGAFALFIAAGVAMTAAANAQAPFGWVEMKPIAGQKSVQIIGRAFSLEQVSDLEFTLSLQRKNRGNSVSSRQSGRVDLTVGETKTLSSTTTSVEQGDEILVELRLFTNRQEVFSAVMSSRNDAWRR